MNTARSMALVKLMEQTQSPEFAFKLNDDANEVCNDTIGNQK
ncbi:DUF2780 domain-containing protein, partial [Pseudomonas syringae pv. tagetis]